MTNQNDRWITEEHYQAANTLAIAGMQVRYYHTDPDYDHLMITLARGELPEQGLLEHLDRILPDYLPADYKYETNPDVHGHDDETGVWVLRLEKRSANRSALSQSKGPFITTADAAELIEIGPGAVSLLIRKKVVQGNSRKSTVSRQDIIRYRHRRFRMVLLPLTGPQHSYAMQGFFNNPYLDLTRIKQIDIVHLWNEYVVLEHDSSLKVTIPGDPRI